MPGPGHTLNLPAYLFFRIQTYWHVYYFKASQPQIYNYDDDDDDDDVDVDVDVDVDDDDDDDDDGLASQPHTYIFIMVRSSPLIY